LIDVRPAGTSLLPDAYVDGINNDSFEIIADPKDITGKKISCKDIINQMDVAYNSKSLVQNIICQYVFWQRLEARIDIKQCLKSGRSDCM
jgi:replication initiation and membrane attachment protein DnaB